MQEAKQRKGLISARHLGIIIKKCQVTICNDRPFLKSNYKKYIVGAHCSSLDSAAVDTDGMPAYVNSTLYPVGP